MNRTVEDYSLTAIAKILGRAKSGLHKLAKSGQITALPNGRYDLATVQRALSVNIDPARRRGVHLASGEQRGERSSEQVNASPPRPVSTPEDAAEAITLIRRILEEEGATVGKVDYQAARTAEMILKSRERALRLEVESGKLVDGTTITKKMFEFSRRNRDAWSNWPSQIAPLLASDLGVDQVRLVVLLENYVRRHLTEMADQWRREPTPTDADRSASTK